MNKQTGYWEYFPWWLGVIIPGHRVDFRADWAIYGSWLYTNDRPLPCFMGLCVWILHRIISVPASSDPSRPLESKADSPECCVKPRPLLLEACDSNSPGSGPFLLMSGFLLSFTHLRSLLSLVRNQFLEPSALSFLFGNCLRMTLEDFWNREMFLCWDVHC